MLFSREKICPICNTELTSYGLFTSNVIRLSCENLSCQLPPFTRFSQIHSIKYDYSVVVKLDNYYYIHSNEDNKYTEIGKMNPFINIEYDSSSKSSYKIIANVRRDCGDATQYVCKKFCRLSYSVPWIDLESSTNFVSRILKIKAFL